MQKIREFWQNLPKKAKVIISLTLITVILSVVGTLIFKGLKNEKNNPAFLDGVWGKLSIDGEYSPLYTLSPQQERKFGILSQEIFVLKSKDPKEENTFKENIIASKPVTVTAKSSTEFEIKPTSELGVDETIQISLASDSDYSWVFQTAPKFKIVDNLPGNEAKNVPVNAGIEITFNNDNFNLDKSDININPSVNFRIDKHNETAAIVPLETLKPKTVYKVTLKKGVRLLSGSDKIEEDHVFSFQTADENQNKGRINLAKNLSEVFPDEPLIAKVYAGNWDSNQTINAQVYKFSSAEDFIASRSKADEVAGSWFQYYGEENQVSTQNLAQVATAEVKIQEKEQLQYLQLPQNLDEGFYLVQFWFDDFKKVEQLWVQSSSIAGYVSVGKRQTAVWVNSAKNESLGSSTIQVVSTGETHTINDEGVVYFETPTVFSSKQNQYMLVVSPQNRQLIIPINALSYATEPSQPVADDFWSYLYHERLMYKPNDTVYFWGVAKNRDTYSPPEKVDIYLGDELKQSVVPLADGSYIGSIKLTDEQVGYSTISSRVNGVTLTESYFQISEYVKPELKIEVEANKKAIMAGDAVNYTARVAFFDGTPASNITVFLSSYQGSGSLDKQEAVIDKNGEAKFKYTSPKNEGSTYPRYEAVTISPEKSGEGTADGYGSVYVYGSDLQIDTTSNQDKDRASLEATISKLDLDRVNNQGLSDPISGVASNQKIELTTTKTWWEQKETGTYYDFVEKITRPTYDYIRHDEVLEKKDIHTDANGKIAYDLRLELNQSYHVEIKATDQHGNTSSKSTYFYYSAYQDNGSQANKAYLNLERDTNLFSLGEEIDITIQKNGAIYQANSNSKFLFVAANRGRQDVLVSNVPEYKFIYESKHIPDIYIGSIIFNGRYYEEVRASCKSNWVCGGYDYYSNEYFFEPMLISYKQDDSKLEVDISADKAKYQPGEEARVSVKVTKNGSPVENASVQIVIVDEALASIGGIRKPSILSSLYKQAASLIYFNYYSHKPVLPDGPQAERGGGGGDRDLFKDTAMFETGQTDANGEKIFTITLPDNITNWLTYAQALTNTMEAGQAEAAIIASKDFFLSSQFPATITLKDTPFIAMSPFGKALKEDSAIPTEIVFYKGEQEIHKNTVNTTAFKEGYSSFPSLPMGSFKVAVRGNYGELQDGVALPVRVIDSRLNFRMTKSKTANKGETISSFDDVNPASKKPVKLVVTDQGKSKYYYDILRYCYQESNRIERQIASRKASQILEKRFNALDCINDNTNLSIFQGNDGGLRPVEWGDTNLETTLWAVYVDQTPFNRGKLIEYFTNDNGSFSNTTEEKILSNWGLTLLGVPKVNELNRLSKTATTYREKVLSGLALQSAGETSRAREIYFQILSEYAFTNKPYLRIQADPNKANYDAYVLDTSYALLLGSLSSGEYEDGLNAYLRDYATQAENVVKDIANIVFIDGQLQGLPQSDTIINFKTSSQNATKNISKEGPLLVNLKQSEVRDFAVNVVEGKAEATLDYFAAPEEFNALKGDDRLTLKRTISKAKGEGSKVKIGDILEVNLRYDFDDNAPLGCYTITDYIPSGMTYVENPGSFGLSYGNKGLLYPIGGNVLSGCAYNSTWWNSYSNNTSVYFMRVTAVGTFIREPAIIQSTMDSSIFQKTQEEFVTVDQ